MTAAGVGAGSSLRARTPSPDAGAASSAERERRWVLALFGLGLLANALLLSLFYRPQWKALVGDERFYVPRIRAYALGDPVAWDPLWPPLYIDAMGSLARLAGGWHPAIVHGAQLLLFFAGAWLFWRIARKLLPGAAALIALAFFLLMPDLAAYTGFHLAEVLHLFFALAAFWLVLEYGRRWWALVAAGVLLGFALASKLLLLAFVPVVLVAVAWRVPGRIAQRAGAAALVAAGMLAATLPFMVRNERLHGVFAIADSSTLNRLITLQDRAPQDWQGARTIRQALDAFNASAPTLAERNRIARAELERALAEKGALRTYAELAPKQYFRLLHHDTHFTTQLPGGPRAAFTLDDGAVATAVRVWAHGVYALLLFAAAFGFAAVRWRLIGGLHVAALFVLYNLAVFLVIITQTRYMVPIYPALMLFGGLGLLAVLQPTRLGAGAPVYRLTLPRMAIGSVAAVLLLAMAFPEFWGGPWSP